MTKLEGSTHRTIVCDACQLPAANPDVCPADGDAAGTGAGSKFSLSPLEASDPLVIQLLALIKPQFEAARKHSKRGVIRNAMVHQEICDDIAAFAASLGCTDIQVFPSSIPGGDGNIEFFLGARRG